MKVVVLLLVAVFAIGTTHGDATCAGDGETAPKKTSGAPPKHYNIILVGATGNLASKYLWKALFEIFKQRFRKNEVRFQIYGAARQEQDDGRKIMSELFLNLVKCSDDECRSLKKSFIEASQYLRLKTERDFQNLAALLDENTQSIYGLSGSPVTYEEGRLVYLSIPPSSYARTSKYVNEYLRPKVGRPWFRVVLEKPFGRDLASAEKLAKKLEGYYDENEIYRIDHYLGKAVVKQILPFRYNNKDNLEPLLNREHVERVDVVMKEKDDVVGRTEFYNEVGIIRDVIQNHLTEMMTLIAMDLPDNSGNISDILQSKVRVLRQVQPPNRHTTLTAQYSSYNMEWLKEQNLANNITTAATFGASVLYVENDRWNGVPFVLMSGKKLDEKSSYVRVLFKNARFCMRVTETACNQQKQLVFLIGGTNLKLPAMIAVSRGLPAPAVKSGWSVRKTKTDVELFGQSLREMVQVVPDAESEPYVELVAAVMDGARHLFVSTEMLLASWKVWTPILELSERRKTPPRQYMGRGKDAERLDFVVTSRGLYFQLDDHDVFTSVTPVDRHPMYAETPSQFRHSPLTTGDEKSVVQALVQDIVRRSEVALADKGVFHLALPGGSTPVPLFRSLSSAPLSWERIHLWLVDERCVPPTSDQSNLRLVERHLLSQVRIPHGNVHPVYVDAANELCSEGPVRSDNIYESLIRRYVPSQSFDLVVVGVGSDGHVASLFPGQPPTPDDRLVTYAESEGHPAKRVTLTLSAINRASHVSVLVLGGAKHDVVTAVSESDDEKKFPIVGVKPATGSLSWYIDHDALFGKSSV